MVGPLEGRDNQAIGQAGLCDCYDEMGALGLANPPMHFLKLPPAVLSFGLRGEVPIRGIPHQLARR
jgi:hypothetical protein